MPVISVLMPAYNAEKYIAAAIQSILDQTFTDFELIIVNDGSTDNTHQVITSFSDPRIKYYQNDGNKGLIYTRNKQIEISCGNYIAFLDSDDLSEPTRLKIQYEFLIKDPTLSFVSTSFYMIDETDKIINSDNCYDFHPQYLKTISLFLNTIATSSVMLNKQHLAEKRFRNEYPVCEDYDLWSRIMVNGKGRVIPAYLIKYRVYSASICKRQPENIIDRRNKIVLNQLEYYFSGHYTSGESLLHLSLVEFSLKNTIQDLPELKNWIIKLLDLNKQYKHFDEQILKQVLYERLLKKLLRLKNYDFSVYQTLLQLKKELQPTLTWELRKKEVAIFAFAVTHKKLVKV